MKVKVLLSAICFGACVSCGSDSVSLKEDASSKPDSGEQQDATGANLPQNYTFESRFVSGKSSVARNGQIFRHALILELNEYIKRLTTSVDTTATEPGDVLAGLLFYLDFDSDTSGDTSLHFVSGMSPSSMQTTFNDISSGKNLRGKLAGNDTKTDHKAWNTDGVFEGWLEGDADSDTPTKLVEYWFSKLDSLAVARSSQNPPKDPDGNAIGKVYITPEGQDLKQLIQKFLLGSVTFSQGQDDYYDDDVEGKGLLASNTQDGEKEFSILEHAWDEGMGYFGAALDYNDYSVEEIAGKGGRDEYQVFHDSNNDDKIDLRFEYNFGNSRNCAKRDRGATVATNYTKTIFAALLKGRFIISQAKDKLTSDDLSSLKIQRDIVSLTWEKCVAATVVHYINEVRADADTFGTGTYDFEAQAKHWSELKGFALGFQFNQRSLMQPVNAEDKGFSELHNWLGDAPVLPNAGQLAIDKYKQNLLNAKNAMRDRYGFKQENIDAW